MNAMLLGVLIGIITAVLDALLMWYGMRRATQNSKNASATVLVALAVRYLLVAAVLAVVLTAGRGRVNAVGVILPMIAQKVVLLVVSLLPKP